MEARSIFILLPLNSHERNLIFPLNPGREVISRPVSRGEGEIRSEDRLTRERGHLGSHLTRIKSGQGLFSRERGGKECLLRFPLPSTDSYLRRGVEENAAATTG